MMLATITLTELLLPMPTACHGFDFCIKEGDGRKRKQER
jgi:hypothetical protein